jgi:putative FmdB family regulatory protein
VPIYDYVCQSCGERTEVIHGVHHAGPEACELCGGRLRRAVSVPAIVFKGSGWAKKDARSGAGRGQPEDKPTADTTATDAKPAADAKPATDREPAVEKKTAADARDPAAR